MEEKYFGSNDVILFLENTAGFLREELRRDEKKLYLMGAVSAIESTCKELEQLKSISENTARVELDVRIGRLEKRYQNK